MARTLSDTLPIVQPRRRYWLLLITVVLVVSAFLIGQTTAKRQAAPTETSSNSLEYAHTSDGAVQAATDHLVRLAESPFLDERSRSQLVKMVVVQGLQSEETTARHANARQIASNLQALLQQYFSDRYSPRTTAEAIDWLMSDYPKHFVLKITPVAFRVDDFYPNSARVSVCASEKLGYRMGGENRFFVATTSVKTIEETWTGSTWRYAGVAQETPDCSQSLSQEFEEYSHVSERAL